MTLDAISVSLRNWLGMLFVRVGTGLGLWIVGVPPALAISGLLAVQQLKGNFVMPMRGTEC